MGRTPIVVTSAVAGLTGVLALHASPSMLSDGHGLTFQGAGSPSAVAPVSAGGGAQAATGPVIDYGYGKISVKVTVSGTTITSVTVASLDYFGSSRSQQIDQQAIPLLQQQAMQAQGSGIQGVSGASYTSQGFQQSLQAALQSLGLK